MSDAVLVIDVQQGLCEGEGVAWDCDGTIARINALTARARVAGVPVVFVQHESAAGDLAYGSRGWRLAEGLQVEAGDLRVRKTTPDAFLRTDLQALLDARGVRRVAVCGMHSEFCIDSTTRGALARGYAVDLVSDAHTSAGNAALAPQQVIAHHNATLASLTSFGPRARAVTSGQWLPGQQGDPQAADALPADAQQDTGGRLRSLYDANGGVAGIFSEKVADYVASRPDYPAALFDMLASSCGIGTDSTVADVAAGTGLLTHGLLQMGCSVVAVEPNAPMRRAADHALARFARYRSVAGSAECLPLDDASVDLVTVGHAFHWFEVGAARAECLRVLRPAGQVALVWNDRLTTDPLHRALDEILDAFGGEKRAALVAHEERGDLAAFFGRTTPAAHRWPHAHRLDAGGLESLAFSRSYMPSRDSPRGRQASRALAELHARFARDGTLLARYTTVAWVARPS
ncbi:MAG: isochorismatase family protein [Lautropia sp.]